MTKSPQPSRIDYYQNIMHYSDYSGISIKYDVLKYNTFRSIFRAVM